MASLVGTPEHTVQCTCCTTGSNKLTFNGVPDYYEKHNDATLAKEMNELSVQDRERLFEEIHGVAADVEESPEFLEQKLQDFDTALSKLSYAKRKVLDRAIFLKPSIRKDQTFKLMFLS